MLDEKFHTMNSQLALVGYLLAGLGKRRSASLGKGKRLIKST